MSTESTCASQYNRLDANNYNNNNTHTHTTTTTTTGHWFVERRDEKKRGKQEGDKLHLDNGERSELDKEPSWPLFAAPASESACQGACMYTLLLVLVT